MKSIRAILTDIDGCLIEEFASLLLLDGLQSYCRRAREEGGAPLAFCTGRSTEAVDVLSKITGAFFDGIPSIIENGAFLYYPKSREAVCYPAMQYAGKYFLDEIKKSLSLTLAETAIRILGKEGSISFVPKNGSMENLEAHIQTLLNNGDKNRLSITHSSTAVDITLAGVNKGSCLKFWEKKTKISLESVLGIGDSQNDIDFLSNVGIPCCPGNAEEAIKRLVIEKGGYAASALCGEGVVEIFNHYKLL